MDAKSGVETILEGLSFVVSFTSAIVSSA